MNLQTLESLNMRCLLSARILLIFCLAILTFETAHADDDAVPIPPRRPSVLRASQAYIDELRERMLNPKPEAAEEALDDIYRPQKSVNATDIELSPTDPKTAAPAPDVESAPLNDDDLAASLKNTSRADIVHALDPNETMPEEKPREEKKKVPVVEHLAEKTPQKEKIPSPKKKTEKPKLDDLFEPAAGDDDQSPPEPSIENSKLISFYMQPAQVKLDTNLVTFLKDHALKLMNDDNDLQIEIRSYATNIKDEAHSDMRISLARALEVRTFLMENQIDPARLKLKPMDNYDKKDPDDRIDLMFIKRP